MIKVYRKTATIKAEQFDGSNKMVDKYRIEYDEAYMVPFRIEALEGWIGIDVGDWIATGVHGEHWLIADAVFKQTYAELPVIQKAVAAYIKKCKHDGIAIASAMDEDKFPKKVADYFRNYYTRDQWIKLQDTFARAWVDGYTVEEA
ncbi:DUF1642 domain-containing protein [Lactiplantibacillus plantarum]